jgi:hypothetical protein
MGKENGEWILRGRTGPGQLRTPEELEARVEELGFLPLFENEVKGFSVEEHTDPADWWTDNEARDPWSWREQLARRGRVAYGKFFGGRAGFVSLDWFPRFANARRDGYDFDALWEEGKAKAKMKRIMDLFPDREELFSNEVRRLAGFGSEGEHGFEGTVTALQMLTYLVIRDFRSRLNKAGQPYGWHIAVLCTPETRWGYDAVTSAYAEDPADSREAIILHLRSCLPEAGEKALRRLMK